MSDYQRELEELESRVSDLKSECKELRRELTARATEVADRVFHRIGADTSPDWEDIVMALESFQSPGES